MQNQANHWPLLKTRLDVFVISILTNLMNKCSLLVKIIAWTFTISEWKILDLGSWLDTQIWLLEPNGLQIQNTLLLQKTKVKYWSGSQKLQRNIDLSSYTKSQELRHLIGARMKETFLPQEEVNMIASYEFGISIHLLKSNQLIFLARSRISNSANQWTRLSRLKDTQTIMMFLIMISKSGI